MSILDEDGAVKAVAQIINKCGGEQTFTVANEEVFSRYLQYYGIDLHNVKLYIGSQLENKRNQEFAICCNLGIQHARLYYRAMKASAETKATLEIQPTATLKEENHIPPKEMYKLNDLKFDDFSLNDKDMLKACLRMFIDLGFVQRFRIEYNVSKLGYVLGELETLSLLLACLCHDLDHRETNNTFLKKSSSPLEQLYSTSTMEHHHFTQCIMILNSEGNQILSHLSSQEYMNVVRVLEEAILATDFTVYN
ncbi:dual 3',5'-cyclic-AMP and -GMP phosphodiesterase 11, partial [Caerostris darwini]